MLPNQNKKSGVVMIRDCDFCSTCQFYQQHKNSVDQFFKNIVRVYCTGYKMDECVRLKLRKEKGKFPQQNMIPTGQVLKHI